MSLYKPPTSPFSPPVHTAESDGVSAANKVVENMLSTCHLTANREAGICAADAFPYTAPEATSPASDATGAMVTSDPHMEQILPHVEVGKTEFAIAIDDLMQSVSQVTNLLADPLGFLSLFFELFKLIFTTAAECLGEILQQQIQFYNQAAQAALDATTKKMRESGIQMSNYIPASSQNNGVWMAQGL